MTAASRGSLTLRTDQMDYNPCVMLDRAGDHAVHMFQLSPTELRWLVTTAGPALLTSIPREAFTDAEA